MTTDINQFGPEFVVAVARAITSWNECDGKYEGIVTSVDQPY